MSNELETGIKTVNIQIDDKTFQELKENGCSIRFAKKIGNLDYNVIWRATKEYSQNISFSWKPLYSIFVTNPFEGGKKVKVSTDPKKISPGETIMLDAHGIFSEAVTGGNPTTLNVINLYGNTHIGISQVAILDGEEAATPIFVSEDQVELGNCEFEPDERVWIWFESDAETGTMIRKHQSNVLLVNLTSRNQISFLYKDGKCSCIE